MRKLKNTTILRNDGALLSGLQCNTLASLVHLSLRSYLSAVRFLHIVNGHSDPLAGKLQLSQLLKGVQRKKSWWTTLDIGQYIQVRNHELTSYNNRLLWAVCCLGFFGFLRSREFTSTSDTFDPTWNLSIDDVAVDSTSDPTMVQIQIKGSKTDRLHRGTTIVLGWTKSLFVRSRLCKLISQ